MCFFISRNKNLIKFSNLISYLHILSCIYESFWNFVKDLSSNKSLPSPCMNFAVFHLKVAGFVAISSLRILLQSINRGVFLLACVF
jgi:hypothetical protein